MLQSSVLGKVYDVWLKSRVFFFLQTIFRFFSSRFAKSSILLFIKREPVVEKAYSRALFSRALMWVSGTVMSLAGGIFGAIARVGAASFTFRAARFLFSGSFVFSLEFFIGGFVFIMFAVPHERWSNTYALYGGLALLAAYLFLVAAGKRTLLQLHELGLPFLLFAIACVFSVFFSRDRDDTIRVLMFYIAAFILMYVIAADITDFRRLNKLMGFIWLAVVVTSIYAIFQRFAGVEVNSSFTDAATNKGVPGRVFSTLDNPNNFAEFLVLFTPLAAAFAMNVKSPTFRVFAVGMTAFPLIALVMTYMRAGWVSMLITAAVFVYYANKKTIPLILLFGIAAIPFLPDSVLTRFASLFSSRDSSINHRQYVWGSMAKIIRDYWQTGIGLGPGSFAVVYPPYAHVAATEGVPHAHMLWLEIVIETGVLGLVSFLWLMLRNVKNAACAIKPHAVGVTRNALIACVAAFSGIAFAGSAEYIWYYPRVLFAFFILLGVCLAASRVPNERT